MPNPCSLCSGKCCREHLITVTSFDIAAIARKTRKKPEEFAFLSPLRMLFFDNDTVLECYGEDDGKGEKLRSDFVLALKSDPCVFLELGKCSIHQFAPMGCRLYPHNLSGALARYAACPALSHLAFRLKGPGMDRGQYREKLEEYRALVARWNRKRGKKGDCLEFLLREASGKP